jgi:hypothetical protein
MICFLRIYLNYFNSWKCSYLELEPDKTDAIFKLIQSSINENESWVLHMFSESGENLFRAVLTAL